MAGQRFTMRRDTARHMPPRPVLLPHPLEPSPYHPLHRGAREGADFRQAPERPHAPPPVPASGEAGAPA